MKSLIQAVFFLSLTFLFSSCFEITEEVNMKTNGSGDMVLTVNMSQSKVNLKNYMNAGEFQGYKIPNQADVEAEILKVKNVLSQMDGMSNVKTTKDWEEFVFTISGKFDNVKTLNESVNKVVVALNKSPFPSIQKDNFDYISGKFSRLFKYLDEYNITDEEYKGLHFTARFVLETAKYISVYRFDKPVNKVTNAKAQVSPNKKAVKMESNFAEIITGKKTIENVISF